MQKPTTTQQPLGYKQCTPDWHKYRDIVFELEIETHGLTHDLTEEWPMLDYDFPRKLSYGWHKYSTQLLTCPLKGMKKGMSFLKIPFLVPSIPLLEIYFCVLWKLLKTPTCLIIIEIYLICKVLNTFQMIGIGGSVL